MDKMLVGDELRLWGSVWVAFFFGWMAELQVFLAGMLIPLVKYDPAGRNCLAPPFSPLSVWENTCSIVPLLPALITVGNEGMQSCKCAFLHARLVYASGCSRFLPCFNLWPHVYTWVLFIFSPYTVHPPAMSLWQCVCLHVFVCCLRVAIGVNWDVTVTTGFVSMVRRVIEGVCWQMPSCVSFLYEFAPIIVFLHTFMQQEVIPSFECAPLWKSKLPFFCPAKETTFTIHPSDNNPCVGE